MIPLSTWFLKKILIIVLEESITQTYKKLVAIQEGDPDSYFPSSNPMSGEVWDNFNTHSSRFFNKTQILTLQVVARRKIEKFREFWKSYSISMPQKTWELQDSFLGYDHLLYASVINKILNRLKISSQCLKIFSISY